jgi:2,4-dienoyl-CoA reductase-like NADH-dependent reductase (Old Yellow Enzyme family)
MPRLFDALQMKGLVLKNRIVMPPMATELASEKGEVTERLLEHYSRRAKGPALIIVEHSYVMQNGKLSKNQLGIYSDELIPALSRLVKSVHDKGTPVAVQINHAGRMAASKITGLQPVAPSPVPASPSTETPHELNLNEIEQIIEGFVSAAARALKAGFDAVEIHGAHGFLLNQFTSPLANKRTDRYGGSLDGRMRFPLEIVSRLRKKVGNDVPLFYRLGADDRLPGGLTLEEGKRIAAKLVEAGVDVVDVSGGLSGSRPSDLKGEGYLIHLAEEVKTGVNVPVIGVGGIVTAQFADQVVKSGRVDLVAVGRAMLGDPDWAVKAITSLK